MVPLRPDETPHETRKRQAEMFERANKLFLDREFAKAGLEPQGEIPVSPLLAAIIKRKSGQ